MVASERDAPFAAVPARSSITTACVPPNAATVPVDATTTPSAGLPSPSGSLQTRAVAPLPAGERSWVKV